jgi:hypothetical protein
MIFRNKIIGKKVRNLAFKTKRDLKIIVKKIIKENYSYKKITSFKV